MKIIPIGYARRIATLLLLSAVAAGCTGYQLVLDETAVLGLDTTKLDYRGTVLNKPQDTFFCKGKEFYGIAFVQAYLTDSPLLAQAAIKKGAGGVSGLGHVIPNDPNAAFHFRQLDIGETDSFTLTNVTPDGGIDLNVTPYLIFELKSSTDLEKPRTFKSGTGGCNRYGDIRVIDLRELN